MCLHEWRAERNVLLDRWRSIAKFLEIPSSPAITKTNWNENAFEWFNSSVDFINVDSSFLVLFEGNGRLSVRVRVMMHLVIPLHFRYKLFNFIDNSLILMHNFVISRTWTWELIIFLSFLFRIEENERMERDRQKQQQKQQMQRISQNQSDNDAPHQPLFGVPFKVRKQQIILIFF